MTNRGRRDAPPRRWTRPGLLLAAMAVAASAAVARANLADDVPGAYAGVAPGQVVSGAGLRALLNALDAGTVPVGTVVAFAGATAPPGWHLCDGSTLGRAQYARLYSVLGTHWGPGDGTTTFALPDLRGRTTLGAGQGVGLTGRELGTRLGEEVHTLTADEMPAHIHTEPQHSHTVMDNGHSHPVVAEVGGTTSEQAAVSMTGSTATMWTAYASVGVALGARTGIQIEPASTQISSTGGGLPHNTMMPAAVVTFIIRVQ